MAGTGIRNRSTSTVSGRSSLSLRRRSNTSETFSMTEQDAQCKHTGAGPDQLPFPVSRSSATASSVDRDDAHLFVERHPFPAFYTPYIQPVFFPKERLMS